MLDYSVPVNKEIPEIPFQAAYRPSYQSLIRKLICYRIKQIDAVKIEM